MEMAVGEATEEYDVLEVVRQMEEEMHTAAEALEFERAAILRDRIREMKQQCADSRSTKK